MEPETKINDAVTEEISRADDDSESDETYSKSPETTKRKNRERLVELTLFFILGVLVGIAMKTEAIKKITMGFDDYKMVIGKQDYDINKFQIDLAKERQEQEATQASSASDGSGSQDAVGGSDGQQGNQSAD